MMKKIILCIILINTLILSGCVIVETDNIVTSETENIKIITMCQDLLVCYDYISKIGGLWCTHDKIIVDKYCGGE